MSGTTKSRSKLVAVPPKSAIPGKPKTLIYGPPGVGKTWCSLSFPTVYFIDTEGGANLGHYTDRLTVAGGVYMGPDQGALSFATVLEQVQALATEKHEFRTLVIDSISKLFNVAIADEAERLVKAGLKNEYGADKKPAVGNMRSLVKWLTKLDMNVLLISHEKDEYGGVGVDREVIGKTFDCWDRLEYELHLCMHIRKNGASRLAKIRKSRLLGFPEGESIPWSYDDFAKRYGRDVLERATTTIELATESQVEEIETLMKVVKMPDGQIEKWFTAADVSSWSEMSTDQIGKCIANVKTRLQPPAIAAE